MRILRHLTSRNPKTIFHKIMLMINAFLIAFFVIQFLINLSQTCVILFYLYYIIFFILQFITHYLCIKLPKMNVQIHDKLLRRIIMFMGVVQTSYLFGAILFWGKSQIHFGYCALCQYYGLPLTIGIAVDIHCFLTIINYANLIYTFITRRYYLLALGGYEVQQRRLQQIQEINNRQQMLQPDLYQYPIDQNKYKGKYCKFDDIDDSIELPENFVCSICLNARLGIIKQDINQDHQQQYDEQKQDRKSKSTNLSKTSKKSHQSFDQTKLEKSKQEETKKVQININLKQKENNQNGQNIVYTPCKHFFHKKCIQNWAKVNPKCPDCRSNLKMIIINQ